MNKILPLIIFGIAFGLLESIVVVYLHHIIGQNLNVVSAKDYSVLLNLGVIAFILPHQPILVTGKIESIEMWREFSTIVMLLSIAYITGGNLKQRIGAFFIAFSVWDIFYYVFLSLLTGWPNNMFNIDVYFLIPVPWVGPVITPVLLSILIFCVGIYLLRRSETKVDKTLMKND